MTDEPSSAQPSSGEPATDNRAEESWTYTGRRDINGKKYYAWQDGSGVERYYAKSAATVIGGRYTVTVTREGKHVSMYADIRYTGEQVDMSARREMEAIDIAAMASLAVKTLERRDARRKALDDAVQPLVEIAAKLNFGHDRDALLAYVIRRITHGW